jgi:hypothetical protein
LLIIWQFTIVGVVKTIIVVLLAPLFDSTVFTTVQMSGIALVTYGVWTYARNGERPQTVREPVAKGVLVEEEQAVLLGNTKS